MAGQVFACGGKGDFQMSHNIEDIVALIDGRRELVEETRNSDKKLFKVILARI